MTHPLDLLREHLKTRYADFDPKYDSISLQRILADIAELKLELEHEQPSIVVQRYTVQAGFRVTIEDWLKVRALRLAEENAVHLAGDNSDVYDERFERNVVAIEVLSQVAQDLAEGREP
jgi:hypothetical protein